MKPHSTFKSRLGLKTLFTCLIQFSLSFGQNDVLIEIPWQEPTEFQVGENTILVPTIEGQQLDSYQPNFFWREEVAGSTNLNVDLEIKATSAANPKEITYLDYHQIDVGEEEYQLTISKAAGERHAVLNLFPFVRVGDQIHRITHLKIKYSKAPSSPIAVQKDFATSSVLQNGSGVWIKIAVTQDGVHKIDRDFLQSHLTPLGVDILIRWIQII